MKNKCLLFLSGMALFASNLVGQGVQPASVVDTADARIRPQVTGDHMIWFTLTAIENERPELDQTLVLREAIPSLVKSLPSSSGILASEILNEFPQNGIVVTLTIDREGRVKRINDASYFVEKILKAALKEWRFLQVSKEGRAKTVEMKVAVNFCLDSAARSTSPKPLYSVYPSYPSELVEEYINLTSITPGHATSNLPKINSRKILVGRLPGSVKIQFSISPDGEVQNPQVLDSNGYIFEARAVAAVLRRKYASLDAQHMGRTLTVSEDVHLYPLGGAALAGTPIELKIIEPAALPSASVAIRRLAQPIYPRALYDTKKTGRAVAQFHIDQHGSVTRISIVEATSPEFGLALQASIEASQFEPLKRNGYPVAAVVQRVEEFSIVRARPAQPLVLVLNPDDTTKVDAKSLDAPLKLIVRQPAVFPLSLRNRVPTGEATVEFIIDRNGWVCAPRIISATEPEFGYSAIQAVSSWGYEPPVADGKLTAIKTLARFHFSGEAGRPN